MSTHMGRALARVRTALAIAVSITLFAAAFAIPAFADVSPSGCLANDFTTELHKSTTIAYDETNPNGATSISYSVAAGNPQNGSLNGCNVDNVTITLTTPDGVVHTLQTGGNYPVGTAVTQVGSPVTYVANSANIVANKLIASSTATGDLHDTPVGTDPLTSTKTVSVAVIHPDTTVTITPAASLVTASTSVDFTVTEHNSGDDAITNPSVTLTPPGMTLSTTSPTFTGGDTGSDGILGIGETWTWVVPLVVNTTTAYTAVGTGLDSLGNAVTAPAYPTESASTTVTVMNEPTIATLLSATTTPVGTAVHDSATLSGATSDAGGSVTYTVYTDGACSAGAESAGTVTVTNGIVPDSTAVTFNSPGTFNWQAVYSGDAKNTAATSTCTSEVLTVNRNSPTIATQISATSVNVGTAVHDSATLSGATGTAGGSVTYTVYTDNACSAGAQNAGTVTVTNGIVPDSNPITFNTAGTFNWQAVYSGDSGNAAATSTCQTETLTVNQPQVGTRTLGFWQTHTSFTESVFAAPPLGGSITLGGMTINTNGKLFGGFYASIPKTSTGDKRSALDQARMQLTQQYLAAVLNCAYFTCSPSTQALISQASTDFSGSNVSAILADASALDAYNNSGDALGSVSAGPATPKDSKSTATVSFWDTLH